MSTNPNQRSILITRNQYDVSETPTYTREAFREVAEKCTKSELLLWCYFADNQDDFYIESLYRDHVYKKVGLKKDSYHAAFCGLVEKGYLVQDKTRKNLFYFQDQI